MVRASPPLKPVSAIVCRPLSRAQVQGAHDVGRAARRRHGDQHVAGPGLRLQLVREDLLVGQVVGDRGEHLDVRAEAHEPGVQVGPGPHALHVVALHVVGDRGRAAVAAGEHPWHRVCRRRAGSLPRGRAQPARPSSRPGRAPRRRRRNTTRRRVRRGRELRGRVPAIGGARSGDRAQCSYRDALQDERGRGGKARIRPDTRALAAVRPKVDRRCPDRLREADVFGPVAHDPRGGQVEVQRRLPPPSPCRAWACGPRSTGRTPRRRRRGGRGSTGTGRRAPRARPAAPRCTGAPGRRRRCRTGPARRRPGSSPPRPGCRPG